MVEIRNFEEAFNILECKKEERKEWKRNFRKLVLKLHPDKLEAVSILNTDTLNAYYATINARNFLSENYHEEQLFSFEKQQLFSFEKPGLQATFCCAINYQVQRYQ